MYSRRIVFYPGEWAALGMTMLILGVALALAMQGGIFGLMQAENGGSVGFLELTAALILTIGVGVILHELGHKFAHQVLYRNPNAVYEPNKPMLIFTLIVGALGSAILFMSPGHVSSRSYSENETGVSKLAGPLVNILLVPVFLALWVLAGSGFLGTVGYYGAIVNAGLSLFNLAPLWLCGVVYQKWGATACLVLGVVAEVAAAHFAGLPFFAKMLLYWAGFAFIAYGLNPYIQQLGRQQASMVGVFLLLGLFMCGGPLAAVPLGGAIVGILQTAAWVFMLAGFFGGIISDLFFMLDGRGVWQWNKAVYTLVLLVAGGLVLGMPNIMRWVASLAG